MQVSEQINDPDMVEDKYLYCGGDRRRIRQNGSSSQRRRYRGNCEKGFGRNSFA